MFPLKRALLVFIAIVLVLGLRPRSDNPQPVQAQEISVQATKAAARRQKRQRRKERQIGRQVRQEQRYQFVQARR